jgi:hypothetical protein
MQPKAVAARPANLPMNLLNVLAVARVSTFSRFIGRFYA